MIWYTGGTYSTSVLRDVVRAVEHTFGIPCTPMGALHTRIDRNTLLKKEKITLVNLWIKLLIFAHCRYVKSRPAL